MVEKNYQIEEILNYLAEAKNEEAFNLLRQEAKKMTEDVRSGNLSTEKLSQTLEPIYTKITQINKESIEPWVWDLLIETVDMQKSGQQFSIKNIEKILEK